MFNTAVLLGTLTGIFLLIGFVIGGFFGITIALVIAVLINFISYWYSDRIVLGIYRARPSKNPSLNRRVEELAREAKIPKPRVYTIRTEIPNAFATGRNPRNAAICLTEGLFELENDELDAVIAHELGHIKNRDILVSTLAATIAGAIAYLAQIGYWSMFLGAGNRRGEGNILALLMMVILAPIAALLIRLAISRSMEFRADRTGALITKKPHALASALRKISEFSREHPLKGSSATSHMWIVNPFRKDWFNSLFSTHPPVEKRIERLEEIKIE